MTVNFRALRIGYDWDWFNQHSQITHAEDTQGIMAIDDASGRPVAACVMDNWTANSVQCHIVIANRYSLRHGVLQTFFTHVFVDCDRKYVYGMVPSDNTKAINLNKHMGFTERLRLPDAYADGVDYIVMELKREDCRFITQSKPKTVELKVV